MKKALLVDDTMITVSGVAEILRKKFRKVGIFLDYVTAADAGVAVIKACSYDIVFMDGTFLLNELGEDRIYAPTQGIEAIRAIREFSEIPIVMISGEGEAQKAGIRAGANCSADKNEWDAWVERAVELIS